MVRLKHRYFLVEIERARNISKKEVDLVPLDAEEQHITYALRNVVCDFHGDFGKAMISSGFRLKYVNLATRIILVRARHGGPDKMVSSSLPFLTKINKENIVCRLLYTGATIRHCMKVLLKRQKNKLLEATKQLKTLGHSKEYLEKTILETRQFGKHF